MVDLYSPSCLTGISRLTGTSHQDVSSKNEREARCNVGTIAETFVELVPLIVLSKYCRTARRLSARTVCAMLALAYL
jgi:hypothetical protein